MIEQSLTHTIKSLDKIFDSVNIKYYNNRLEKPILSVSVSKRRTSLGWCSANKIWRGERDYFEINISPNCLSKGAKEVFQIMMHECVHLHCVQNNIKDTSRAGAYHNAMFKKQAESRGLECDKTANGWSETVLSPESENWAIGEIKKLELHLLYRQTPAGRKNASHSIKYICPSCNCIIRATKTINAICADCDDCFIISY